MTTAARRALTILHTADVHLGLDGADVDPQMREYRDIIHWAFSMVIDTAMQENVDLLVIAGDLFDSNRPSRDAVDFAVEELRRAQRPIVMIPGNHDCLHLESIYRQIDIPAACPTLHLLAHPDGELYRMPEHNLVIWGRGMVEHEPSYRPLAGLPPRQGEAWHVALAHGFFVEDGASSPRSSLISATEIRDSGWDYVALGHCHTFTDVSQGSVKAYYSGAPGFFPKMPGGDGSVALVQCEGDERRRVAVTRIDLRPLVYAAMGYDG